MFLYPFGAGLQHARRMRASRAVRATCCEMRARNRTLVRYIESCPPKISFATAVDGTAWRHAAKQHNLTDSVAELRQIAGGRDDILAEAAGITVGSSYAWPSTHVGHELITAGMLIMAGGGNGKPLDYDELERWTRIGHERGMRSRH
jgi:hypothetical protein